MSVRLTRNVAARAAAVASGAIAIGIAAAALGGAASASAPAAHDPAPTRDMRVAEERLERLVDRGIRDGGPFFTAEERAIIERACGYDAGSFDGFTANLRDGVFICSNGRRVDTPEVRAVMAAAGPRITERLDRTLGSAEFREAVSAIAARASEQAMRAVRESGVAEGAGRRAAAEAARSSRHWSAETQAEVRRALAEAEVVRARALANIDIDVEAALRDAREDIRAAEREIERSLREERRERRR